PAVAVDPAAMPGSGARVVARPAEEPLSGDGPGAGPSPGGSGDSTQQVTEREDTIRGR
ncbi:two-component system, OmpR family, sensor histidine kinase MtrB, partial [Streptomyces sp. MnatMP-M17]